MENAARVKGQGLTLKMSLHSVSIQFSKNASQVPTTFPPLYVRVSHGSQSTSSSTVTLSELHHRSGNYVANWEAGSPPITVEFHRSADGAAVAPAELKFHLKIFSEKRQSHKSLASTTLHTADLNLAEVLTTERKQLMLSVGRNATAAIHNCELDVTFEYECREEQHLATPPGCLHTSPSLPEVQQLKDETSITTQQDSSEMRLLETSFQDSVSAAASLQHLVSAHCDTTSATPNAASQTTLQSTVVVDVRQHSPPQKADGLRANSKGKKLKGIFKLKGRKQKTKDKQLDTAKVTVVPIGSQDVKTSPQVNAIRSREHQKSMPNTSAMEEFRKVTIGPRHTEDCNTPNVSEPATQQVEANESLSPQPEWSVKPRLSRQPHVQGKKPTLEKIGRQTTTDASLQDKLHQMSAGLPPSEVTQRFEAQMHTGKISRASGTAILSSSRRLKYHMQPHTESVVAPPASKLPHPPQLSKAFSESSSGIENSYHKQQEMSRIKQQHDPIVPKAPGSHQVNAPISAAMNEFHKVTTPANPNETATTQIQKPIPGSEMKYNGSEPIDSTVSKTYQVQDRSVQKVKKQRRNDGSLQAKSKVVSEASAAKHPAESSTKSTGSAGTNDPPMSTIPSQSSSAEGIKHHIMRPRSQSAAILVPKHNRARQLSSALSQSRLGVNDLQPKTSGSSQQNPRRLSVSDLVKPIERSARQIQSKQGKGDLHGILKIRVCGASVADGPRPPNENLSDLIGKMQDPTQDLKQSPTEGLYCVLTINGSNARTETTSQPMVSSKPVVWSKSEEAIFHTSQSRQVFIMCRKTKLSSSTTKATSTPLNAKSIKDDVCIGAAVLSVADIRVAASNSSSQEQYEVKYLPLQPKGSVLLEASFSALQPRFKISCKGTVTVMKLSGVKCNPDHDLCCTIKIDSEFQDSTSTVAAKDCSTNGWKDDPIEFNACYNHDCNLQMWAYSSEETEYWCGGCVIPLAMALPEHDAKYHQEHDYDKPYVVSQACEKTVTLPVEPVGMLVLSFMLYPSPRNVKGDDRRLGKHLDTTDSETKDRSHSEIKPKSLRRNLTSTYNSEDFGLKVRTTYKEQPFLLQQENADLRKEVEYLKEELRQAKASLAESEFFKEKALLELRAALEEVSRLKRH